VESTSAEDKLLLIVQRLAMAELKAHQAAINEALRAWNAGFVTGRGGDPRQLNETLKSLCLACARAGFGSGRDVGRLEATIKLMRQEAKPSDYGEASQEEVAGQPHPSEIDGYGDAAALAELDRETG
jgi:hypothetical protein